jgi:GNAT superfamily N-acetyltransferase
MRVEIRRFEERDLDWVVRRHVAIYAEEEGFDESFETYVAGPVASFWANFDADRENMWVAEVAGSAVGAVAIVKAAEGWAQLRWFFLNREARGQGIGKSLLGEAIAFCRDKHYTGILLWTVSQLLPARALYARYGFKRVEEVPHEIWGKHLIEERWELTL